MTVSGENADKQKKEEEGAALLSLFGVLAET